MSMIQSAQVFSPRPNATATENLRVLQSPIKPFKTPAKESAADYRNDTDHESDDEQEVVLVEGDSPIVVQEEKDLVILENVEVDDTDEHLKTPTQQAHGYARTQASPLRHFPAPPTLLQTPQRYMQSQTPRQRGYSSALHRAVLIRSAQRAIMKAEVEKEEAEEEREVEESIAVGGPVSHEGSDCSSISSEEGSEEVDDDKADITEQNEDDAMSNWRHRFEGIRISSIEHDTPAEHEEEIDITEVCLRFLGHSILADCNVLQVDITGEPITERDEQIAQALESIQDRTSNHALNVAQQHEHHSTAQTPTFPRRFINFSTPQVNRVSNRSQGVGRYSLGGTSFDNGGVRRVIVEQAWRVRDITLPENTPSIKEEREDEQPHTNSLSSPGREFERRRPTLSDEERKVNPSYIIHIICSTVC